MGAFNHLWVSFLLLNQIQIFETEKSGFGSHDVCKEFAKNR